MLTINLDEENRIVQLVPDGDLSENDFVNAAHIIDPFIDKAGKLDGLIICTKQFPGWDSFGALIKHLRFVKGHHQKVKLVAIVTDSVLGNFAEHVVGHFISAKIKHFSFSQLNEAQEWIVNSG